MASGACFTGLVLYILFALSYYALIKAILSLVYAARPFLGLNSIDAGQLKGFTLPHPALPPRTPLTLALTPTLALALPLTLTLTLPSLRAGPASALTSVTFSTPFPALPSFVPS